MSLERDHQNAGMDLLRADATLTVYPDAQGFVPEAVALPYVRVYTGVAWPKDGDANAFDGLSVTCTVRWYCHIVAESENGVFVVAGKVRAALLDKRPAITGRNCDLIYFEADSGNPTNRSELGGQQRYEATITYAMLSVPG